MWDFHFWLKLNQCFFTSSLPENTQNQLVYIYSYIIDVRHCTQQNSFSHLPHAVTIGTGLWWCSHHCHLLATQWLHSWSIVQSPCCWEFIMVTTLSLSSSHVVTVPSWWLMEFCCVCVHITLSVHCWNVPVYLIWAVLGTLLLKIKCLPVCSQWNNRDFGIFAIEWM